MAEETQQAAATETKPETAAESFNTLNGLLDGNITPTVTETATETNTSTETRDAKPEQTTTPTDITINFDDNASTETKDDKGNAAPPDDFEAKFAARVKEYFGDEPEKIKTKLSVEPAPKGMTAEDFMSFVAHEDFQNFVARDFAKMDAVDLLDFDLAQQMPDWSPEKRQQVLAAEFNLYEESTKQEVELAMAKMALRAKPLAEKFEAKKDALIKDKFSAYTNQQPQQTPEDAQKIAQKQEYWKREFPAVKQACEKFSVTVKLPTLDDGKKTEDVPLSFMMTPAALSNMEKWIADNAARLDMKPEELAQAAIRDFMGANHEKAIQRAVAQAVSARDEAWKKRLGNYVPTPQGKNPTHETAKPNDFKIFTGLMGE